VNAAVPVAHYNRQLPGHLPLHSLLSSASDADQRSHREDTVAGAQMPPDGALDRRRHPYGDRASSFASAHSRGQHGAGQPSLSGARLGRGWFKALLAISSGGQKADVV
jgi:hypothetical protein